MAILSIPTTSTSDVFARAGVAMLSRFANVETYIDGGTSAVVGFRTREPAMPSVAGLSVLAAQTEVTYMVADLPVNAGVGSFVAIGSDIFEVMLATPNEPLGWMTFTLEKA